MSTVRDVWVVPIECGECLGQLNSFAFQDGLCSVVVVGSLFSLVSFSLVYLDLE